jgi:hypothetical protein
MEPILQNFFSKKDMKFMVSKDEPLSSILIVSIISIKIFMLLAIVFTCTMGI